MIEVLAGTSSWGSDKASNEMIGWSVGSSIRGSFAAISPWLVITKSIWSMSPKDNRSKSMDAGVMVTTGAGTRV